MLERFVQNYFLLIFSIIPISIVAGPTVSLINVLLIDFSFLIIILIKKDFSFLKKKSFLYLLLLYIYLIFNSIISVDAGSGMARNIGFLRIIILFAAFNYFFREKLFLKKIFFVWMIIISLISLDVFYEILNGKNLFGYVSNHGRRVVSFFKDEPIVGGYINAFFFMIVGFLYEYSDKKKNYILFISLIIFFLSIFLTGERSNTIKAFLGIILFLTLIQNYNFKQKITATLISILVVFTVISNSNYLKLRYITQIKNSFQEEQLYLNIYRSGYDVFKNHKFFGAGNKNYRVVTCSENKPKSSNYLCETHPHQIYLELLSEHGIIGTIIIFFVLYKLVFSKIIFNSRELNKIQLGSMVYILLTFLPILQKKFVKF